MLVLFFFSFNISLGYIWKKRNRTGNETERIDERKSLLIISNIFILKMSSVIMIIFIYWYNKNFFKNVS